MKMVRKIFSVLLFATLTGSLGFGFFAIANTFASLDSPSVSDATLASTTANKASTTFATTYWRQANDRCINLHDLYIDDATRQFEWQSCGYYSDAVELGIVKPTLDEHLMPSPAYDSSASAKLAGLRFANRNIYGDNFYRWFHSVAGLSDEQNAVLKFDYSVADDTYTYKNEDFHPIGDVLFTMSLAIPFSTTGEGHFKITADDDTWVFLDNDLVIDLGGIHQPITASFDLVENGTIRIFHANRDSANSLMDIKISHVALPIFDTAVAYDASSYVAPLGESKTTTPDYRNAIINTITLEFIILGFLILATPFAVRLIIKH